jgi:diguanylate cyclase (GGDEF)-like protein/PAS domain S-box-containing protein
VTATVSPADRCDSPEPPDGTRALPAGDIDRAAVATTWARAIEQTTYVPMSAQDTERYLLDLVHQVVDALHTRPFTAEPAIEVGRKLVGAEFIGQHSLQVTVDILGAALMANAGGATNSQLTRNIVALLSGVATGYASQMRLRTLDQQEHIKQALLKSKNDAEASERKLRAQFEEVFRFAAIGIALTDLNGTCVQTNPALAEILERPEAELRGSSIYDLFAEENDDELRRSYQDVADGYYPRSRQRRRMRRGDGTIAPVYCVTSVLRDADERPSHYVTMVENVSELQELQNQLGHQSLHDSLTGLFNRQHFESKVSAAVESAHEQSSITLIYLGVDALSVINHGLGHDAGDKVLKVVANKLLSVFSLTEYTVSRVGGDEFAVLINDDQDLPDVQDLVNDINSELSEPVYLDDTGVAVCASIGVFQHTGPFRTDADPLRAASSTMRKAKASGKRQWELYDPHFDHDERARFAIAAAMPGAWENGELDIEYEPLIRLTDNGIAGVEVRLRWDHKDHGVIDNVRCEEMAERTGMSLTMGPWVFERASEQVRDQLSLLDDENSDWPAKLRLRLTRMQSSDGDLTAVMNRMIDESGLPPTRIEVALDTRAVLAEQGVALDNLRTLADIGVVIGLHEFSGGYREFALVEDLDIRSVILSGDHNQACRRDNQESALAEVTIGMVTSLHRRGTLVSVVDVPSDHGARWWRAIGADLAQGPFAGAPGPLDEVLSHHKP